MKEASLTIEAATQRHNADLWRFFLSHDPFGRLYNYITMMLHSMLSYTNTSIYSTKRKLKRVASEEDRSDDVVRGALSFLEQPEDRKAGSKIKVERSACSL